MQSQDRTDESAKNAPVRAAGEVGADVSEDELFREWKAQHTAFGLVLVVYAFLMGLAPLVARNSDEMAQMFCALLPASGNWWTWVAGASALCLVAILMIAGKQRLKTAG